MGWSNANPIFDEFARETRFVHIDRDDRIRLLAKLIALLQGQDWDTEDESLSEFRDDEAVVEAFRRCLIIITCGDEGPAGSYSCKLEQLPRGHRDGMHKDFQGRSWPVSTS